MVRRGEKVTVDIPVTVTGDVVPDGLLDQQLVQISVEAEATNIPPGIEVSVENMPIGTAVHAGDLALPAGVSLAVEADVLVLHVLAAPTAEQMEAELGLPEEGEAVPAAPAAPAPAGAEGGGQPEAAADQPSSSRYVIRLPHCRSALPHRLPRQPAAPLPVHPPPPLRPV